MVFFIFYVSFIWPSVNEIDICASLCVCAQLANLISSSGFAQKSQTVSKTFGNSLNSHKKQSPGNFEHVQNFGHVQNYLAHLWRLSLWQFVTLEEHSPGKKLLMWREDCSLLPEGRGLNKPCRERSDVIWPKRLPGPGDLQFLNGWGLAAFSAASAMRCSLCLSLPVSKAYHMAM